MEWCIAVVDEVFFGRVGLGVDASDALFVGVSRCWCGWIYGAGWVDGVDCWIFWSGVVGLGPDVDPVDVDGGVVVACGGDDAAALVCPDVVGVLEFPGESDGELFSLGDELGFGHLPDEVVIDVERVAFVAVVHAEAVVVAVHVVGNVDAWQVGGCFIGKAVAWVGGARRCGVLCAAASGGVRAVDSGLEAVVDVGYEFEDVDFGAGVGVAVKGLTVRVEQPERPPGVVGGGGLVKTHRRFDENAVGGVDVVAVALVVASAQVGVLARGLVEDHFESAVVGSGLIPVKGLVAIK